MDSILNKPHKKFDVIKRFYPHYYLGRTRDFSLIYVEKPGGIELEGLKHAGVTADDLLWHSVFLTEYQWKYIESDEKSQSVSILDLNGIGMSDFVGDTVTFLKKTISIAQEHYPERSKGIFVLNVPYWFDVIMRIVKQFVSPGTLKKIQVFRYGFQTKLLEEIDEEVLPISYGGTSSIEPYSTPMEIDLRKVVYQRLVQENCCQVGVDGLEDEVSLKRMEEYLNTH